MNNKFAGYLALLYAAHRMVRIFAFYDMYRDMGREEVKREYADVDIGIEPADMEEALARADCLIDIHLSILSRITTVERFFDDPINLIPIIAARQSRLKQLGREMFRRQLPNISQAERTVDQFLKFIEEVAPFVEVGRPIPIRGKVRIEDWVARMDADMRNAFPHAQAKYSQIPIVKPDEYEIG